MSAKINDKGKKIPVPHKVTEKALLKAIEGTGGLVSVIAQKLGVSWDTANKAIQYYASAKGAIESEKETNIDIAESVVLKNIRKSAQMQQAGYAGVDSSDARWYLSRMAKHRGYADEGINIQNNNIADGAKVTLYMPDNGRDGQLSNVEEQTKSNKKK